jgi:hypothetical protein
VTAHHHSYTRVHRCTHRHTHAPVGSLITPYSVAASLPLVVVVVSAALPARDDDVAHDGMPVPSSCNCPYPAAVLVVLLADVLDVDDAAGGGGGGGMSCCCIAACTALIEV